MARDRFPNGVSSPVFDDTGHLMPGLVDNRQTEAQQRQEIAARLIAQGTSPTDALRLANQVTLITVTPQEIRQNRIDGLVRTYTQQGVSPERARQIAIGDVDGFGSESYLDSTIDYSAANREALARMLGVSPDTIIDVASRPNDVTRIINEARRVRSILDDEAVQRFGNDPVALSAAFRQNDITATQYRALLIDVTFATPERMADAQTLVNRVLGFVQAGGGAALMAAGALATPSVVGTGLGIAGIGLGADQVAAGLNAMIDGVPVKTFLERGLIASGMTEQQAAVAAGMISLSPMALELALTNASVRSSLIARGIPASLLETPPLLATRLSVEDKLSRYLLDPQHPTGGTKAEWFRSALGFDRTNSRSLAEQIVFDEASAVQTSITQHGPLFNQSISIVGANGRTINVTFGWIRNNDGIVRLVTAIPTAK